MQAELTKEQALALLDNPRHGKFDNELAELVYELSLDSSYWDAQESEGDGGASLTFLQPFGIFCALYEDTQGFVNLTIFDDEEQYKTAMEAEENNDFWQNQNGFWPEELPYCYECRGTIDPDHIFGNEDDDFYCESCWEGLGLGEDRE